MIFQRQRSWMEMSYLRSAEKKIYIPLITAFEKKSFFKIMPLIDMLGYAFV